MPFWKKKINLKNAPPKQHHFEKKKKKEKEKQRRRRRMVGIASVLTG
jgi:hypothetical protein